MGKPFGSYSKRSGRLTILKVLAAHPEGLPSAKILELVQAEYACGRNSLAAVLCHLVTLGVVARLERKACSHCNARAQHYTLGYRSKEYLEGN